MGGDKTMCRLLWTFMSPEEPPTPIPPKHLSVSGAKFLGHVARFSCISMTNHVKSCKQFNEVGRRTEFKYLLRGTGSPTAKKNLKKKTWKQKRLSFRVIAPFSIRLWNLGRTYQKSTKWEMVWWRGWRGLLVELFKCVCFMMYLCYYWNLFDSILKFISIRRSEKQ